MKKRFSKYDFNYGYRHYKGFKELSTEDKRKFLSDWQTIALHPILSCDENWILFFDNMTEKDFFESWASQDYMHPLYSQIAENSLAIKKCQERFERYKATNNESKCNKIDKKIAKLLLERQNLLELKKKFETGKQINIAIDANNISEKYVNKIIKLCDNIYSHNCPEIKIMVASSDKSIDSKIEYYYTQEQLQCLSKLQEKLEYYNKDNQADCELRFCELLNFPTSLEAYKQLWDLEDVKKANQFVEEARIVIANKKLSPLEAVMYIYMKIADHFRYNGQEGFCDGEHSIIGAFSDKKLITCAGFASMFKIAVDVLHSKKLSAEFVPTEEAFYGHCFNLVNIVDKYYKVKGTYAIDLTANSKAAGVADIADFAGILLRFSDALYDRDSIFFISIPKSRIDQTCFCFDDEMKEIARQKRALPNVKLKTRIDKQISETNNFIMNHDGICHPIEHKTIISAYLNMMNRTDQPIAFEKLAAMIERTCLSYLSISSQSCKSSWLNLLNIDAIKAEFENKSKRSEPKSEMREYLDKKNIKPLIDCSYTAEEMVNAIYQSKDKERYFSEEYFALLKKVKQVIDQINADNQK